MKKEMQKQTFMERFMAAKDVMLGRIPKQKGQASPFFWGNFVQNSVMPQSKPEINYQKLRALSETPIPRRAIRYIKSQVSRLDKGFVVKKGKKLTAMQKKQIEVLNAVLESPNGQDTWTTMLEKWIEDMLVLGWSTTVIKEWDKKEHPLLLFPSDAASFQVYMDWNGSPKMRRYAQFDLHGQRVDFLPSELFTIIFDPRTSDPFGLAPLSACANEVEYLLQAMAYSSSVASQAHPKKLLHLGEDADSEFVRETRVYWSDEVEGRGRLPILGGTKAPTSIELGADSDESLFLKWQERLILIIANAFGLDPQKMNIIAGINRSTGDTLDDVSDEGSIRPIAACIETAINDFFLRRYDLYDVAEFKFKFTTSNTDRKALAVIHQIMLQDETMTVNEAREEMGYPPLPIDPKTGVSKGDYTLTEYRARYGISMVGDTGAREALPNHEKGKNGVYSAKQPKEKAMNQGKELITDISKSS